MRKSALAAGGIALALTLSACGGDGGGASDALGSGDSGALFSNVEQLVASASEKTEQSKSSKFSMEMAMAGQKISAQGEALYAGADTKMAMTMDMQGMSMEMRMLDGTIYIKMPQQLSGQLGASKPWMKMSLDSNSAMAQSMGNLDQMAEQSDPTKMLEQLKQAGAKITNSESTTLDGQQVTHYTVEFDPAKAAGMFGGGTLTEQQKQQMSQLGMIPMEIYLNSGGLPVQIEMDMASVMKSAGAPASGEAKMVMKYTDWGAPVTIEAPPADQVGEMPQMPSN